jgi:hypothetical protein
MPTATVGVNIQKRSRESGLAPGYSVWPLQRVTLRRRDGLPTRIGQVDHPGCRTIPAGAAFRPIIEH